MNNRLNNRLSEVRHLMTRLHLDATLVSSIPNITYLTSFSHFSKIEREAFLFIVARPQGSPYENTKTFGYFLTDARYSEAVKDNIKNFELVEISRRRTFEKALKNLAKKHKVKRVGFDHHDITVAEHKKFSRVFKKIRHFNLNNLRKIKSNHEILAIEKACRLGDETFEYILNKIKLGVTEKQLAFEIEFFIKRHGADISFPPIVAFGKNSSIPHHVPTHNSKLLTHNSIILLDFGAKIDNYCSDMTRTVFFGKPTPKQKRIYQTVLSAQRRAIDLLKSSIINHKSIAAKYIDKIARDYIISKGYPTIPHSLGHGIGLEVHESPRLSPKSKEILKEGMVFTIEPGVYIPNFGGIRIEDVVVLKKENPRLLTKSSKEIIEI